MLGLIQRSEGRRHALLQDLLQNDQRASIFPRILQILLFSMRLRVSLIFLICIVLGVMLVSCAGNQPPAGSFVDYERVWDFPEVIHLTDGEGLDVGVAGVMDVDVAGDYLWLAGINPEELIVAFKLEDGTRAGGFFKLGNGPGELLSPPLFNIFRIEEGRILRGSLYDGRKEYVVYDMERSLSSGFPVEISCDIVPAGLESCIAVGERGYFCRRWNERESGLTRYIWKSGRKESLSLCAPLEKLQITVPSDGYNFNLAGTAMGYHAGRGCVVEACLFLNMIHLYSLDGSFSKTVCYGRRADDLSRLERLPFLEVQRRFNDVRVFDDFFAVLYEGHDVLLFNWSGDPLFRFVLPEKADSFDMDLSRGIIYALGIEEERIVKYGITKDLP